MRQPHALYRFFGSDEQLLYIGITLNPGNRWKQHRDDKPWWTEVANVTLEPFPDRESVLDAERAAIAAEQPRYNVVHNSGATKQRTPPNRTNGLPRCEICNKRGYTQGHTIIGFFDRPTIACSNCRSGKRRHEAHAKAWPECGIEWHDPYDHNSMSFTAFSTSRIPEIHRAAQTPDRCPQCDESSWYLPYEWRKNLAVYSCSNQHIWTCHWTTPPNQRGAVHELAGVNFTTRHNLDPTTHRKPTKQQTDYAVIIQNIRSIPPEKRDIILQNAGWQTCNDQWTSHLGRWVDLSPMEAIYVEVSWQTHSNALIYGNQECRGCNWCNPDSGLSKPLNQLAKGRP